MKRLLRFSGVALLALTIGVFGCGDDETPVAPTVTVTVPPPAPPPPPPPPPLETTMLPTSAEVAVGSSVVFAVNASGGAAGATASWICASSDTDIATASGTSTGCEATGVAVGGVTITAVVTKGSETGNVGSQLTVTGPQVGDQAFVLIASIKWGDDNNTATTGLKGRVDVEANVERGDQVLEVLTLLVDGDSVDAQDFGVAAEPAMDEPAAQAIHAFTLSFDSHDYDTATGDVDYENVDHEISVQLKVAGSEPISSNVLTVDFDNDDGVHVAVSGLDTGALNPMTGERWYGGPAAMIEITAVPVLYSGGSASAVTLKDFCGADAATSSGDDEDRFVFTPDCEEMTHEAESPVFTLTVGGEEIEVGADDIRNSDDEIFPINLDYEGPGAPTFIPNPNFREGGWVNTAVAFMSTDSEDKNAWLTKGTSDVGVGGYTPQLRFAPVPEGKDGLKEALAATAYQAVPPGVVADSEPNAYCVVASAVDKLGNESARPDEDDGTCEMAGVASRDAIADDPATGENEEAANVEAAGYAGLVQAAAAEADADDPTDTDDAEALANTGLQVGVDLTPPEAIFAGASLGKDAKALFAEQTQYILHVTDNRGLRAAEPVVDTLEIRGTGGVVGAMTTTEEAEIGLPLVDVDFTADEVGYYTYTAQAQDMAGNLSEPAISRTAIHDETEPVSALIFARGKDAFNYDKTLVMADNLSIRDYTVTISAPNLPEPVRLKRAMVSGYAGDLDQTETVSGPVVLPFIAVQSTPGDVDSGELITTFTAHVTDQAGNAAADPEPVTITVDDQNGGDEDVDSDQGVAQGVADVAYVITVKDDDGPITATNTTNPAVEKSDETITLTVTATLGLTTTANPFAKVYFFAEVGEINTGLASSGEGDRRELRMIGMFDGVHAKLETTGNRKWTYETEISADDYYAIVGGAAAVDGVATNEIHALAVNGKGVALALTFGDLMILKR